MYQLYVTVLLVDFPPLVTSEYITPPVQEPSDTMGFDHVSNIMMM